MIDQQLLEKLRTLQAEIPDGHGAVYAKVFADSSGSIDLDMWGVTVATASFGEKFWLRRSTVAHNNPAWLPQLEALVEKLNTHMP
jgi:hypothetical protein